MLRYSRSKSGLGVDSKQVSRFSHLKFVGAPCSIRKIISVAHVTIILNIATELPSASSSQYHNPRGTLTFFNFKGENEDFLLPYFFVNYLRKRAQCY